MVLLNELRACQLTEAYAHKKLPYKNGGVNWDHDGDVHERKEVLKDVRVGLPRVGQPQRGQRKLECAADDDGHVWHGQDDQEVVEHRPVLLPTDDHQGDKVDDQSGHRHGQDQLVKHLRRVQLSFIFLRWCTQ